MLQSSSLWFSRLDQLPDKFEGRLTVPFANLETFLGPHRIRDLLSRSSEVVRKIVFVNSWCLERNESEALWRIYGSGPDGGVAIVTKYGSLANELPENCFIGKISYLNYNYEAFNTKNLLTYGMNKRVQFQHEAEARAVRFEFHQNKDEPVESILVRSPLGIPEPIDLSKLIQRVLVSPYAPEWHLGLIENLVRRYGNSFSVQRSEMSMEPFIATPLFAANSSQHDEPSQSRPQVR